MTSSHVLSLSGGAVAGITWSVIVGVICIASAVIVWAYFRLQAHRADAVAMAEYRRLAEEAVANQQELRAELTKLTEKVAAVEKLMREVG
jgi:predicted negative regulator of RcsB-dependent stress response